MPKWGEDFDTWEPTRDYPTAPPAKSAQLGRISTPRQTRPSLPHSSTDARAASFFQEFSAATEAAGQAANPRAPELPYGDNPGIAALIANAQNMLNSDGPDAPDSFGDSFQARTARRTGTGATGNAPGAAVGAGTSAPGAAGALGASSRGASTPGVDFSGFPLEELPEALRETLRNRVSAGSGEKRGNAGAGMAPHENGNGRRGVGFDSGNGLAYGASLEEGVREVARPARRVAAPEPARSEGWQKLVQGWDDMKKSPDSEPAGSAGIFADETASFAGVSGFFPAPSEPIAGNGVGGNGKSAGAAGSGVRAGTGSANAAALEAPFGDSAGISGLAPHESAAMGPDATALGATGTPTDRETRAGDAAVNPAGGTPTPPLEPPVWKSISAATPDGPTKLRFRRVDPEGETGKTAATREHADGLSPVAMIAAAVLLSLISVGIGVGVGVNLSPTPRATMTVSASPAPTVEPGGDNPDSVSNKGDQSARDGERTTTGGLRGLKVALDPGHNGGNAAAWQQIGRNVDDGRGGQRACNTTGTATDDGFAEHEFNWKVANVLKSRLEAAGAIVLMTRDSDVGVGPCVNDRGAFGQKVGADVMVSIHANGSTNSAVHGFFAMISDPPLRESQKEPSAKLAAALVGALKDSGLTPQNSGPIVGGLWKRSDLATLNFAEVPAVMLELGEMRNPADASLMKTENGREKFATGIFNGLEAWAREARPGASGTAASPGAIAPGAASSSATGGTGSASSSTATASPGAASPSGSPSASPGTVASPSATSSAGNTASPGTTSSPETTSSPAASPTVSPGAQ